MKSCGTVLSLEQMTGRGYPNLTTQSVRKMKISWPLVIWKKKAFSVSCFFPFDSQILRILQTVVYVVYWQDNISFSKNVVTNLLSQLLLTSFYEFFQLEYPKLPKSPLVLTSFNDHVPAVKRFVKAKSNY